MIVRVKLFAIARAIAGVDQLELELPDNATVADLRAELITRLPELTAGAAHLMFAVGNQYASDATPVGPDQELACIPPVSGG